MAISTNPLTAYPTGGMRLLLRMPTLLYRMGLGSALDLFNIMILTTRGRVSGAPRYTPLEYRRHGRKLYAIASWGQQSQWLQNLQQHPEVTLRRGGQVIAARASVVHNKSEALLVLHLFRRNNPLMIFDAAFGRLGQGPTYDPRPLPESGDEATIVRFDVLPSDPDLPAPPDDLRWLWLIWGVGAVIAAVYSLTSTLRSRE